MALRRYRNSPKIKASKLNSYDSLDSTWWEWRVEVTPGIGDLYGGGKLAIKAREAYNKLQNLENRFVGKITSRLKVKNRDRFVRNKRRNGGSDAKKGIRERNRQLGTKEDTRGKGGHHMDSVKDNPDRMTVPRNVDFLSRKDHLDAHGGKFGNSTSSNGVEIHRN